MASSSNDPTTGAPVFADGDAPDLAVNPTEVGSYAADVGNRIVRDAAGMAAYAYARDGLKCYNTDDGFEYLHNGTGWNLVWTPRIKLRVYSVGAVTANTDITFGTIAEDTDAGWASTQYTIPVEGDYMIHTALKANGSGFSGTGSVAIRKDGTTIARGRNVQSGVAFDGVTLTIIEPCLAGDVITIQHGSAFTGQNDSPAASNFLEIRRLN